MADKTSIVVSMYNSKPETIEVVDKLLMPSLKQNIDSNKQLILLDDNSPLKNETNQMIEKHRPDLERELGDFQYHNNEQNLGFSGSYNKGMKLAEGKNILIANDDIYLPQGSIDALTNVLDSYKEAGAVGPVTNYAYNFQNTNLFKGIENYSKEELQKIEKFATWLKETMKDEIYVSEDGLIGFCLGLKQDTLKDVGYFDERFKYGMFEDTDLNRRIINSGKEVLLDSSTFVEHGGVEGGSASLNQDKIKAINAFLQNAIKYNNKWGDSYLDTLKRIHNSYLQAKGTNTITKDIIEKSGMAEEDICKVYANKKEKN